MANTGGEPSISRFDCGSNEHAFYYIDEAPPIDQEVLSSQVDDPSPKDVPTAICMKADGVNLIEVPVEVQAIDGEELDDPNYVEDDENDTKESEDFIDTSEDDDIYDTLKDPMLLTQVNSWMCKKSTTNRSSISHARLCENANNVEKFSDYEDSDELVSLNGSENSDDDTALKWPEFNEKTDLHENVELVKGMKFDSNVSFRKALMEWTIKRGYDIKYIHNDKSRVTATCKDSCGWRIHASPTQDNSCFQIKSFNPIHQCGRHYDNKRVTTKWVASMLITLNKCNMLLNNIAETFNAYIKEARDKPIITMLEMIRRQLMKRFHMKRDGMFTCRHSICPRILEKLEVSKKDAMNCLVYVGGHRTFEVSHCNEGNKVVNLIERTCTCIKWQMTGIPCSHVVAAILDERGRPENYVDEIFSKETLLKAYDWHIHPMPGEEDWPECNYDEILPPNVKITPGRPKKKRIREEGEPSNAHKISKKGTKIKCGNCNMEGHNAIERKSSE
ncbi:Zinc finger, PMZ-type [Sesbania bispinosa]|nr:Zinc finger, PMZ-type [Sesbania bispinosa]